METTFNKLDEIRGISKSEGCDALLISGDFFNFKSWLRNNYLLTNKLTDYFLSLNIPCFGIIGDHDVPDRREESIDRQPIGALARGARIRLLSKGEEVELEKGVFITGSPKTDNYEEDLSNYLPSRPKGAKLLIHMVHGDLYPKKPVYEPWTPYSALKDSNADITLRGHIHADANVVEVGKTRIIGIGSLTRGTFNTDSINRRPKVAIITTETKDINVIELKSAPKTEDIFDLEKHDKLERAELEIDHLAALIQQESKNIELNGLDSIRSAIRDLKIAQPIKDTCNRILDKSEEFA